MLTFWHISFCCFYIMCTHIISHTHVWMCVCDKADSYVNVTENRDFQSWKMERQIISMWLKKACTPAFVFCFVLNIYLFVCLFVYLFILAALCLSCTMWESSLRHAGSLVVVCRLLFLIFIYLFIYNLKFFLIFNFIFFLYSRFFLVIHFIHISVYMSIPISQFITPPPPHPTFPPWCPYVCSLHLCLYFCLQTGSSVPFL